MISRGIPLVGYLTVWIQENVDDPEVYHLISHGLNLKQLLH